MDKVNDTEADGFDMTDDIAMDFIKFGKKKDDEIVFNPPKPISDKAMTIAYAVLVILWCSKVLLMLKYY